MAMQALLVYLTTNSLQAPFHIGPVGDSSHRSTIDGLVTIPIGSGDSGFTAMVTTPVATVGALACAAVGGSSGSDSASILAAMGPVADIGLSDVKLGLTLTTSPACLAPSLTAGIELGECEGDPCPLQFLHDAADGLTLYMHGNVFVGSASVTIGIGMQPFEVSPGWLLSDQNGVGLSVEVGLSKSVGSITADIGLVMPLKMPITPLSTDPEGEAESTDEVEYAYLSGRLSVSISNGVFGLNGQLSMENAVWTEAFGIPQLYFVDVMVGIGVNLPTLLPQKLELGGRFCLGTVSVCTSMLCPPNGVCASDTVASPCATAMVAPGPPPAYILGQLQVGLDATSPAGNYFMGKTTAVTVGTILGIFAADFDTSDIPDNVLDSGIYPKLRNRCSNKCQGADPPKNCFARISVSSTTQSVGVGTSTVNIPQGLAVAGQLDLLGWKFMVEATVGPTTFKIDAEMSPVSIEIGGHEVLSITKELENDSAGPAFLVDFAWGPTDAHAAISIAGAVAIPALGITGDATVLLDAEGFHIDTAFDVLLLTAEVKFDWSWVENSDISFSIAISWEDALEKIQALLETAAENILG
jgi:hypothetical protein